MSVLIDKNTKVIGQGITGREATNRAAQLPERSEGDPPSL